VVCPGRGTALPATGRRWYRTSLPGARTVLSTRAARSGRHGGCKRCGITRPTGKQSRRAHGTAKRAHISPDRHIPSTPSGILQLLRDARANNTAETCRPSHGGCDALHIRAKRVPDTASQTTLLPLATVSRLLVLGRAKRQALSTPSPGEPTLGAGLPVLILINPNNPILHPVRLPDYNYGATLVRTGMCVHFIESHKTRGGYQADRHRQPALLPLATAFETPFFPSNSHFGGTDGDAPV
jgi:hypothetical protein